MTRSLHPSLLRSNRGLTERQTDRQTDILTDASTHRLNRPSGSIQWKVIPVWSPDTVSNVSNNRGESSNKPWLSVKGLIVSRAAPTSKLSKKNQFWSQRMQLYWLVQTLGNKHINREPALLKRHNCFYSLLCSIYSIGVLASWGCN